MALWLYVTIFLVQKCLFQTWYCSVQRRAELRAQEAFEEQMERERVLLEQFHEDSGTARATISELIANVKKYNDEDDKHSNKLVKPFICSPH